jgi:hypothetical protein
MNTNNSKYNDSQEIISNWDLDDWSISKECFEKIVDLLPFGKTILELGSGESTRILSKFYNMISVEENINFINKYNSNYLHVPTEKVTYNNFDKDTVWYSTKILKEKLGTLKYDLILIDGPCGWRGGFYENRHIFDLNCILLFDDTMCEEHYKLMKMVSDYVNRPFININCKVNPKAVHWFNGKQFGYII